MEDLEQIITDSINDVELPADPLGEDTQPVDAAPAEPVEVVPEATPAPVDPAPDATPVDDFDKRYGLTAQSSSGRENRIPYSRVKKITANAEKTAVDAYKKEAEANFVPVTKFQEYEAKVKDYESRLQGVAQFEDLMLNKPVEFLKRLVALPQYAQIFNQPVQPQVEAQPTAQEDPMPEPDQALSDGSRVYSMEGLKSLLAWQSRAVENKVTQQMESKYKPLYDDFSNYQAAQAALPAVNAQIADARTWPLFNENEEEIVKVLQAYPNASLERAYQHVVLPKIQQAQEAQKTEYQKQLDTAKADRLKMRAELLAELKQAPQATSVPSSGARAAAAPTGGSRSLEDVIAEAIKTLK